jgi:hypothetical protein
LIGDYWPISGHGAVLVTTRSSGKQQTINLPSERNLEVEPFGYGKVPQHNGPGREADSDTGAGFLLHMAHRRRVADGEIDAARWVAAELRGNALALDQLAGLVNRQGWTIQSFADMYLDVKIDHEQPKYEHTLDTVWELSFSSVRSDALSMLLMSSLLSVEVITKEFFEVPEPNYLPATLSFCSDHDRCVHKSLEFRLFTSLDKHLNTWHVRSQKRC